MDLSTGLIASVLVAFIFFGWGLFNKDKKVRLDAKYSIFFATLAFLALWIYGSNRPDR